MKREISFSLILNNSGENMRNRKIQNYSSQEEYLINKGLNDKKVIRDLIDYKYNNPELSMKRLPTEMYDKVNLMCRNYMDRLARFEMDYDFVIDVEKFRNVAVCCLETVLCLRSQVINHPVSPYWKVSDYDINNFVIVEETDDIDKSKNEFFSREIPLKNCVQMNIGLFLHNDRTYICFIWNHMCMDGGGFKMFWSDFCRNYSDYVNEGISPVHFSFGSRKYTDVYKDFPAEKQKRAKKQFANVSPRIKHIFPFENNNREDNVIIVSRKIEEEYFLKAKSYAKGVGATITDLLLSTYIYSFSKITGINKNERISVACAIDLRRHMKEISDIGYTNHVSFVHCDLEKQGSDYRETISLVSNKMKDIKKDEFIGLHGLPLLNIAYKTMIYLQAENVVKLFYNNPKLSVSNVGIIDPDEFSLGKNGPFDAFVAGAAKNKPCAVMTALTINNTLSVSMCLRGNEKDKVVLEEFFTEFEKNIKSF